jgi:hypothetical protein
MLKYKIFLHTLAIFFSDLFSEIFNNEIIVYHSKFNYICKKEIRLFQEQVWFKS